MGKKARMKRERREQRVWSGKEPQPSEQPQQGRDLVPEGALLVRKTIRVNKIESYFKLDETADSDPCKVLWALFHYNGELLDPVVVNSTDILEWDADTMDEPEISMSDGERFLTHEGVPNPPWAFPPGYWVWFGHQELVTFGCGTTLMCFVGTWRAPQGQEFIAWHEADFA